MTANPVAVISRGVGRNPLDRASDTITTTVRLTQLVRNRITKLVGEKGMAAFLREAAENELARREQPDLRTKAERAKRGRG